MRKVVYLDPPGKSPLYRKIRRVVEQEDSTLAPLHPKEVPLYKRWLDHFLMEVHPAVLARQRLA